MSWRRDSSTIAGGIAAALGKGFLIAAAGLTVAALFGSPPVAAASLWTVVATAIAGCSCMLTAAVIRRGQCDAEEEAKREMRELVSIVRKLSGVDEMDVSMLEGRHQEPEAFTSRLHRERCEQAVGSKVR